MTLIKKTVKSTRVVPPRSRKTKGTTAAKAKAVVVSKRKKKRKARS